MCGKDPRTACFYTCIAEILGAFLGFCVACSAIKFQDNFNDAIDKYSDYGHPIDNSSPINVASVAALFFFFAILAGGFGVHGYRSRNRWFYLIHIVCALFISLSFFALFIHSIVQFKKMHSHVTNSEVKFKEYEAKLNQTEITEDNKLMKMETADMEEVKQRLLFPVMLFFGNIAVYLSSALFAYKSWKVLIDGSTGMKPFENEDERPNPID